MNDNSYYLVRTAPKAYDYDTGTDVVVVLGEFIVGSYRIRRYDNGDSAAHYQQNRDQSGMCYVSEVHDSLAGALEDLARLVRLLDRS